jgi:hypothetical protein
MASSNSWLRDLWDLAHLLELRCHPIAIPRFATAGTCADPDGAKWRNPYESRSVAGRCRHRIGVVCIS